MGSFPGVKQSEGEATNTPPPDTEIRKKYSDTSTPCMLSHNTQEKVYRHTFTYRSLTTYLLNTSRASSTELGALVHHLLEI